MKLSSILLSGTLSLAMLPLAVAGCTGVSPYMAPGSRGGIEAAQDSATVVFVRPSEYGGAARIVIMDGKGRFLGETMPMTYFATKVPAGEHMFLSWGENTSAIKATLAAGKIYYVEAYGPTGAGTPRLELRAVGVKSSAWGKIDGWLAKANALQPDAPAGQAYLQGHASGVESAVRHGNEEVASYKPNELAEHTLTVEDGR